MIQFLIHEKSDTVGVATMDIKAGGDAEGLFMDSQETIKVKALKDIPLVFYTATYKDKRDEELALKLGADRYLIKPMEPDKLLKILQDLMRDVEKGKVVPKKPVLEEKE